MNHPINDGGPAFPVPMFTRESDGQPMSAGEFFEGGNGMSTRTWLAGMAMQGLLSSQTEGYSFSIKKDAAQEATEYADALLAALSATPEAKAPPAPAYAMANPLYAIVEQMDAKGGPFERRLAAAILAADGENIAKIVAAFPEVIERYDAFASNARKDQPADQFPEL